MCLEKILAKIRFGGYLFLAKTSKAGGSFFGARNRGADPSVGFVGFFVPE